MGNVGFNGNHCLMCLCVSRKKKPLSPSVFKYTVRMMKDAHSEPFTVIANQIR